MLNDKRCMFKINNIITYIMHKVLDIFLSKKKKKKLFWVHVDKKERQLNKLDVDLAINNVWAKVITMNISIIKFVYLKKKKKRLM